MSTERLCALPILVRRMQAGSDVLFPKIPIGSGSCRTRMPVHFARALATILALSILRAGPAQAQIPNPLDTTFNVSSSQTVPSSLTIGSSPGSVGELASPGTVSISENLTVGNSGTGTLNITSGGTVSNEAGFSSIGEEEGSSGTVTVTGVNAQTGTHSTWTTNGTTNGGFPGLLFIGFSGTGELTIANGGIVRAERGVQLGGAFSGTGTLNIGAAPGSPSVAPGTLETPEVTLGAPLPGQTPPPGGSGTGTLNFNHTATDYHFAPEIRGHGDVNVLNGTTILEANNTDYDGNTTIERGTLAVGVPEALGTGDVFLLGGRCVQQVWRKPASP